MKPLLGFPTSRLLNFLTLITVVSACQYDHIPLFDEQSRSFIRCDLWKPSCPPRGECEVAGRDVRGKLGLRRDQADFLCCIDPKRLQADPHVTQSPGFRSPNSVVPKRIPPRPRPDGHWPSDPFSSYQPPAPRLLFPDNRQFPNNNIHPRGFVTSPPNVNPQINARGPPPNFSSQINPRGMWEQSGPEPTYPIPHAARNSEDGSVLDRINGKLQLKLSQNTAQEGAFWSGDGNVPDSFRATPSSLLPNRLPDPRSPFQGAPEPTTLNPWANGYRAQTTTPYSRIYTFTTPPLTPPPPGAFPWSRPEFRVSKGDEADFPTPQPFLQMLEERLKIWSKPEEVEQTRAPPPTTPRPQFDVWGRPIHYAWTSLETAKTAVKMKTGDEVEEETTLFPPHLVPMDQVKGDHDINNQYFPETPGTNGKVFPWDVKLPPGQNPQHYMRTTTRPVTTPSTTTTTTTPATTTPVLPPATPISSPPVPAVTLTPIMPTLGSAYSYQQPGAGGDAIVLSIIIGDASSPTADGVYKWSGSVTLIQDDGYNILVDSGTAANRQTLIQGLAAHGLRPENVQILVITHGHPDHIGNDNLFPLAVKVFNNLLYKGNDIMESHQMKGDVFQLTKNVEMWKTAGHTMQHSSAIVRNVANFGSVAVAGDLFINAEDLVDPTIWNKQSLDSRTQSANRLKILCQVDVVVPGHGPMYRLTPEFKLQQCTQKKNT